MLPSPLALACVCAALLAVRAGPYNGQCTSVMRGVETNNMIALPPTVLELRDSNVYIQNNCATAFYGQRVNVCDADVAPTVVAPQWPAFSPVFVHRRGAMQTPAYVYVYQYCQPQ